MGDVKPWSAEVGIDDQFGWNDFLITGEVGKGGEISIKPLDHFSEETVKEIAGKSNGFPTPEQFKANPMFRPGDQIFQYGKGGPLIVRRSTLRDECPKVASNHLYPLKSEDEVRAFAAFSGLGQDDNWCDASVPGLKSGHSVSTPWDLMTPAGLNAMKDTLQAIRQAKKDSSKDIEGMAGKLSDARLTEIEKDLDHRIDALKDKGFFDQPWHVMLLHATIGGAGFGIGMGIIGGIWLLLKAAASHIGKGGGGSGGSGTPSSGEENKAPAKPKVAYKGAGAALMGTDEAGASSESVSVSNPSVTTPRVTAPSVTVGGPGAVVVPNAVAAPKLAPKLVPVVP